VTPDEVRAAAGRLAELHQRFAPLFGYQPAEDHALTYLRGLLRHDGRKNTEAIALVFADGQVRALQQFIASSPWDAGPIQQEIQADFTETLVASTAAWDVGTLGVIDESALSQEGRPLRRRGPPVVRPARQEGQLPGRRLPRRRHPGRLGPAGAPTLLARGVDPR
jgi:DDE superfamily endonuclease